MKFEVLKRSHLKRNIIIGVIVIAAISALVLNYTRAKYRTAESMPLINGTINYDLADLNTVAVYIEDETATDGYAKADTIPTSGYTFNEEMSYCSIDGNRDDSITLSYDMMMQALSVTPLTTKGTKCYLYFDEQPAIKDTLLAYYPTVLTRSDFSTTVTDTTTGTIYKSADESQYDNDGEVYYFAGNPTDNWVSFAGYYWRIIRVNGDGTIRLIYNGTNIETIYLQSTASSSVFNSSYDNNAHVGYMYTIEELHGIKTSSTVKGILDTWYINNLLNYGKVIDDNAGFCGDRTPYSGTGIGSGTNLTYYEAYNRLYTNKEPTYSCSNNNDLYTASSSNKGNKALTYPVGLITADEVAYAGGVYGSNNINFYLYSEPAYWTMTPSNCMITSSVFYVTSYGNINPSTVNTSYILRPVINLKADVTISSGNGTSTQPFVIATS